MDYSEYGDLTGTGYDAKEVVAPEDEFFHSIYVSGEERTNQTGVTEKEGLLQIRGAEYNKKEVYGIISHTKQVLCKQHRTKDKKDHIDCFSFQEGDAPWKGTSGNVCGKNRAERATNPFCGDCRAQLIVTLMLTDVNGSPLVDAKGKGIFGFIRGKGMKYSNVSDYLNNMSRMDLDPIFSPPSDASVRFEKSVVNNKRFVTIITAGKADSEYGKKDVFELNPGTKLSSKAVLDILKIAKKTIPKFNEKFNWSSRGSNQGTTQVDQTNQIPTAEPQTTQESIQTIPSVQTPAVQTPVKPTEVNFDEVKFDF